MDTRFDRLARALARTRTVLAQSGVALPPQQGTADERRTVLVLCQGLRFAKIAASIGDRYDIVGAYTDPVAIDFMISRPFDALIIDEASVDVPPEDTIERVRSHPTLRETPRIVIAQAPRYDQISGATIVQDLEQLVARLNPLTLACMTARRARAQMEELKTIGIDTTALGLNSLRALEAHCRCAAQTFEAPLALALLHVGISTASAPDMMRPAPAKNLRSLITLIRSLTRTEDLLFDLENGQFALLLAGADAIDGRIVTDRLTAIMENSVTMDSETMEIINPLILSGVVSLDGYIDLATALTHAQKRIDDEGSARGVRQ